MRRATWIVWLMLALLPLRGWAVAGMGVPTSLPMPGPAAMAEAGEDKAKEEGKCGEGKCGEGQCGAGAGAPKAHEEGKCGEGQCGDDTKAEDSAEEEEQ